MNTSETERARPLLRALDHLDRGEWQKAHGIVQELESQEAYWLHGIVHILEGDMPGCTREVCGRTGLCALCQAGDHAFDQHFADVLLHVLARMDRKRAGILRDLYVFDAP